MKQSGSSRAAASCPAVVSTPLMWDSAHELGHYPKPKPNPRHKRTEITSAKTPSPDCVLIHSSPSPLLQYGSKAASWREYSKHRSRDSELTPTTPLRLASRKSIPALPIRTSDSAACGLETPKSNTIKSNGLNFTQSNNEDQATRFWKPESPNHPNKSGCSSTSLLSVLTLDAMAPLSRARAQGCCLC